MTPDEPERARGPFIGRDDHAVHGQTQLVPVTRRTTGRGAICTDCGLVLEEDLAVQDTPDGPPTLGWTCRDCDNVFALEVAPKRAREMVAATSPPAFAMVVATRPIRYRDGTLATIPVVDVDADEVDGDDEDGDRALVADGGSNSHAGSVLAQLKQADRNGELPDEVRDDLDEETRAALEDGDSERECAVCEQVKPDVEERCLAPIGYTTTLACDFCAALYEEVDPADGISTSAPVGDDDCCIICGAEDTFGYVELEFRLDDSDAHISGDLCEEDADRLADRLFSWRDREQGLTEEVVRREVDELEAAQGGDDDG